MSIVYSYILTEILMRYVHMQIQEHESPTFFEPERYFLDLQFIVYRIIVD